MAEFVCGVREKNPNYLSACENVPEYRDTGYCVLHYPGEEKKKEDFLKVVKSKLDRKHYNFGGTVFPDGTSDFKRREFDAPTIFAGAMFFGEAYFTGAKFSGAQTDFTGAKFSGEKTSFLEVEFGSTETSFQEVTFTELVDFDEATFRDKVAFLGTKEKQVFGPRTVTTFERSRIDKPELLTFNTVLLHPGWFINADVRKVDFTDVQWYGMPGGPKGKIEAEVKALAERRVESPYTLLSQACRRLSANAEENREYPLANEFHYWSMNALRLGSWSVLYEALLKDEVRRHINEREHRNIRFRDLWSPNALDVRALLRKDTRDQINGRGRFGLVNSLYWALSGYGVRAARAFWALVMLWAVFATFYMLVDPSEFKEFGQGLGFLWQASVYSLLALARLNPEPMPEEPGLFQFLVGLEGNLGPLQIALLALAVRRKVMR